jgi:putative peptidoglycan lipid II flippase
VGLGASQITFVVITILATGLPQTGALSAFNLGMLLLQIPLGVIGVPLGIVLLPALSTEVATGTMERFLGVVGRALRLLAFVMLPIAAIGMVLSREVVDLLFNYAAFDQAAVEMTAAVLLILLIGLAAHSMIAVLARSFYAEQDTLTPVIAAIAAVIVNVVVAYATVSPYGLGGLAFAIAAGAWLEASVLLIILRRRHPELDVARLAVTFGRSLVAALVAGALALGTVTVLNGPLPMDAGKLAVLGRAVIAGGIGALGYLAMSLVLRAPELPALVGVATDLVRRPRAA